MTEVDKGLPACNFDEHYGYINSLPPTPASGGHCDTVSKAGIQKYRNDWIPDQVRNDKTGVPRLFTISSSLIINIDYFPFLCKFFKQFSLSSIFT